MNGIHDMGGMHGFGPVQREIDEPVFHADWEGVVVAMSRVISAQGLMNIDESRYGIEQLPPARYLTASYYERWLDRTVRTLVAKGIIAEDELDGWVQKLTESPATPLPAPCDVAATAETVMSVRAGRNYRREGPTPGFSVGDVVLTRNSHPHGHTRLPRYARGKRGVVVSSHGCYVYPDTNAENLGEDPQPLYTVRFTAQELWSDSAQGRSSVNLDLWESYLTPITHEEA